MRATELQFGSLIAYCPRPDPNSPDQLNAKNLTYALKSDRYVQTSTSSTILMSDWVARTVSQERGTLPFGDFFESNPTLVPVPKSSLIAPNALWVPDRIAKALAKEGMGKVSRLLERVKPIRKSAQTDSWNRPTALEHFQTMGVVQTISEPEAVVLVDDVITRGATLMGAANRLLDSYPRLFVRAFAAMRTQSNRLSYKYDNGACVGTITLRPDGSTTRRP